MFPILRGELAKRGITIRNLSELTGIPYSTLTPKLRGEKPIAIDEARAIRDAIGAKMTIDRLFDVDVEY